MTLILQWNRRMVTEIVYDADQRAEFRADIRHYLAMLRHERSGRHPCNDDPILYDVLIIK